MPAPETQIALANLQALARARVLLVDMPDPDLARALIEHRSVDSVVAFHHHATAAARAPRADGVEVAVGPWPAGIQADAALIRLPKETARLDLILAAVQPLVIADGPILVVGHNDAGIKSVARRMREQGFDPEVLDYRHHCRIYAAPSPAGHAAFDPGAWEQTVPLAAGGRSLSVASFPGVFAHGKLDAGTALLLESLAVSDGVRALDLGSGCGVIATWLAAADAVVDAADADALAVEATRRTAWYNSVAVRAIHSDGYGAIDGRYDLIACNPPFHAGVRTTTSAARAMIAGASDHLERKGELWIVANRFLPYMPLLEDAFPSVKVEAEDPRFRVYRARR